MFVTKQIYLKITVASLFILSFFIFNNIENNLNKIINVNEQLIASGHSTGSHSSHHGTGHRSQTHHHKSTSHVSKHTGTHQKASVTSHIHEQGMTPQLPMNPLPPYTDNFPIHHGSPMIEGGGNILRHGTPTILQYDQERGEVYKDTSEVPSTPNPTPPEKCVKLQNRIALKQLHLQRWTQVLQRDKAAQASLMSKLPGGKTSSQLSIEESKLVAQLNDINSRIAQDNLDLAISKRDPVKVEQLQDHLQLDIDRKTDVESQLTKVRNQIASISSDLETRIIENEDNVSLDNEVISTIQNQISEMQEQLSLCQ